MPWKENYRKVMQTRSDFQNLFGSFGRQDRTDYRNCPYYSVTCLKRNQPKFQAIKKEHDLHKRTWKKQLVTPMELIILSELSETQLPLFIDKIAPDLDQNDCLCLVLKSQHYRFSATRFWLPLVKADFVDILEDSK